MFYLLQLSQLLLSPKLPCWVSCCILASFSAPCSTAPWDSSWLGVVPPPAAPDILLLATRAHRVMGKPISEKGRHCCNIKASLSACIPQWSWHSDVSEWVLLHPPAGRSLRRILLQSAGSHPQHELCPVQHCAGRLESFWLHVIAVVWRQFCSVCVDDQSGGSFFFPLERWRWPCSIFFFIIHSNTNTFVSRGQCWWCWDAAPLLHCTLSGTLQSCIYF